VLPDPQAGFRWAALRQGKHRREDREGKERVVSCGLLLERGGITPSFTTNSGIRRCCYSFLTLYPALQSWLGGGTTAVGSSWIYSLKRRQSDTNICSGSVLARSRGRGAAITVTSSISVVIFTAVCVNELVLTCVRALPSSDKVTLRDQSTSATADRFLLLNTRLLCLSIARNLLRLSVCLSVMIYLSVSHGRLLCLLWCRPPMHSRGRVFALFAVLVCTKQQK